MKSDYGYISRFREQVQIFILACVVHKFSPAHETLTLDLGIGA